MSARPMRRDRRGGVLVVGDDAFAQAWRDTIAATVIHSRQMFDAIGRVANATAQAPIETVIVSQQALRSATPLAAEAIGRVDPSVQVVRIGDDPPVTTRGIDRSFGCDTSARVVATDLGLALSAEPAPASPASAPTPRPTPAARPAPAVTRTPRDAAVVDREPAQPLGQPRVVKRADDLGDTDLVAAMLSPDGDPIGTAMALLQQQTGWSDVELRDHLPSAASGVNHAVVTRAASDASEHFGWLCSPSVSGGQLEPWAAWLAHWLELNRAHATYREMAYHDELTGSHNRRYYHQFLEPLLAEARRMRRAVTVMVFDLDDFKRYNDEFGHEAGDLILMETVRLLKSVIRSGDRVCRIGGDEFAVVFADMDEPREAGSAHPETVEEIARRFQDQIAKMRFPKLGMEAPGSLSISGGLATFPWDGTDAEALLRHADQLALESKRKGKNVITFGPGTSRR